MRNWSGDALVIAPTSVMAYLRTRGWQQRPSFTERATIWTLADEEDQDAYEILLPLSQDVRDFRLRMAEVMHTLEVAEQRPAAQIAVDLQAATVGEDFEVRGYVIRLDRPEGQVGGTVTVSAPVEGKSHKILMGLSEAQYENAVRAHAQEAMISCTGELWRHGRSFTLESPRDFRMLGEQG